MRSRDPETGKAITLLTNNFRLSAWEVAELYRCRWHVELFFKWIKQHLRIKAFYGTSDNAVRTQIWIAICSYVLVAILKKRLHSELSLYTMLQILSVSLFEKIELSQAFSRAKLAIPEESTCNQLRLFDLSPDTSDVSYDREQLAMLWREHAALLRKYGAHAQAAVLELCAAEFEDACRERATARVSLDEAVVLTGFSRSHLRRLWRIGKKVRRLGTPKNPEFYFVDLPWKPGYIRQNKSVASDAAQPVNSLKQVARAVVKGE